MNNHYALIIFKLYTWQQLSDEVFSDEVWRKNDEDDLGARQAFESVLHVCIIKKMARCYTTISLRTTCMKNDTDCWGAR